VMGHLLAGRPRTGTQVSSGPDPRPNVKRLLPYRTPRPEVKTRLDANESPIVPPGIGKRIIEQVSQLELNRYPSRARLSELAGAIGAMHGLSESEVVLGNGSNEVLLAIHLAYGGPGRRAVYFEPTYTVYSAVSMLAGTKPVALGRLDDFSIPEVAIEEAGRIGASIVHLCSPNNPTGNEDPEGFAAMVAAALPNTVVVVDEAYAPFGKDSGITELLAGENVVVVRTFSKAAGLAGLRIGYGLAAGRLAETLKKSFLPYNLDAVSIEAASICVEEASAIREVEEVLSKERDRIFASIEGHPSLIAYPSSANFVLFGPQGAGRAQADDDSSSEARSLNDSAKKLWEGLLESSVLVRDCTAWPGLTGCLRVSAGFPDQTDHFIEALGEAVARIVT
jgi:histidinol-phosphate aminotransferase